MADIKKLLKRKGGWTGREIGKLIIANYINDLKRQRGEKVPQMFSQGEITSLVNTLSALEDFQQVEVYQSITVGVTDAYNYCVAMEQQFFHGYFLSLYHFDRYQQQGQEVTRLGYQPYIVTQAQYDKMAEQVRSRKAAFTANYSSIFFTILGRILDRHDEDHIPHGILEALEATEKADARKSSYYGTYNEKMGEGYWVYADGAREDQLTEEQLEEYNAASVVTDMDKANEQKTQLAELCYRGADFIRAFIKEQTGEDTEAEDAALEKAANDLLSGIGWHHRNPLAMLIKGAVEKAVGDCVKDPVKKKVSWHPSDEPPQALTYGEVLPVMVDDYFAIEAERDTKALMKLIQKECPSLYGAITEYIEATIPLAAKAKKTVTKDFITRKELEAFGVYGFTDADGSETVNNNSLASLYDEDKTLKGYIIRKQIATAGIAILQNGNTQIDEQGDYSPIFGRLPFLGDFERLSEANQDFLRGRYYKLIVPALKRINATNIAMDIIARAYGITDITPCVTYKIEKLDKHIAAYNKVLLSTYQVFQQVDYDGTKQKVLRYSFPLIDKADFEIQEEKIKQVEKEIKKIGYYNGAAEALRYFDKFIEQLMGVREI